MDAYTLWRAWYAMEDLRPEGTVGDPAYDAWTAECARLYASARAAEAAPVAPVSPFVRRALARELPAKEIAR